MTIGEDHCLVLKMCLGPHNDQPLCGPRWSLSGPEILGPENDQIVWSLSGPGRCHTEPLLRGSNSGHTGHLFGTICFRTTSFCKNNSCWVLTDSLQPSMKCSALP